MYMGADGWYWVHSYHPAYEHLGRGVVTEMRRCESGIRTWRADPGEYYHQGTGELGGMWRLSRPLPSHVAGTGMSSEGFDISTLLCAHAGEQRSRASSWAFEGIEYDEKLGNLGSSAAAPPAPSSTSSIRCSDRPPHTLVVATSAGRHTEGYLLVMEDYGFSQQGSTARSTRAFVRISPITRRPTAEDALHSVDRLLRLAALERTARTIFRNWSEMSSIVS